MRYLLTCFVVLLFFFHGGQTMAQERLPFDKVVGHSTGCAQFSIYHPEDFSDRRDFPAGWENERWILRRDFDAGKMVIWCSGSDGAANFRFTKSGLTALEKSKVAISHGFRLRSTRGFVYFDNCTTIPCEDVEVLSPSHDPEGWLPLENGDYKVTVHSLDWFQNGAEPPEEDPQAHFVIAFEKVSDISKVELKHQRFAIPHLRPSVKFHQQFELYKPKPKETKAEEETEKLKDSYAALSTQTPYTSPKIKLATLNPNNKEEFDYYDAIKKFGPVVFLLSKDANVGFINDFRGGVKEEDENYFQAHYSAYGPAVKIKSFTPGEPFGKVLVERFEPPKKPASVEQFAALRKEFVRYFSSENYAKTKYSAPIYSTMQAKYCENHELLPFVLGDTYFLDQKLMFELEFESEASKIERLLKWLKTQ